jgi:hypothetical protein
MAQALRVRLEARTAEDAVHQPVLTNTLGHLDRQKAPLEALARLIIRVFPSITVIKDAAETAAHILSHIMFGRETYMAEGRKIASAASRNGVMA